MSSHVSKSMPREASRMFNKVIGDEIQLRKIKEEAEQKKQKMMADPEYKIGELRRTLLKELSESNKKNPEASVSNIKEFVQKTEYFIEQEFKKKTEYDKKLKKSVKLDCDTDNAILKRIENRKLLKLQEQMKLGTPKHLDAFVKNYNLHIDNMVNFDVETNFEYNISEYFLNFINSHMQVLYSRFANMILNKQKYLQAKAETGV